MNALPLIDRELRVSARRPSLYWTRSGVAGAIYIAWFVILGAIPAAAGVYAKAQVLFWTVAIPAFGFCLFAGVFLTADCISGEKRDGTLGLLFLTDLKGRDVVMGKLAATSLHAIYGLIGILPMLSLPMLFGGVAFGELFRIILVLCVTLSLSLTTGLAVSVVSRDVRLATAGALLLLFVLSAVPPLIWWVAGTFLPGAKGGLHLLMLASPPCGLCFAADALYNVEGGGWDFGAFILVQLALIAGFGRFRLARPAHFVRGKRAVQRQS